MKGRREGEKVSRHGEISLGAVSLTASEDKDCLLDDLDILIGTNMLNLHLCKLAYKS